MKLSKKEENELLKVYDTWWESYLNGDINTYDSYLDDDFRFVGSTEGEEFLDKAKTTSFLEATADQLAGKAKLENIERTWELLEGMVLFTDLADAFILDGENWVYYSRFRFTSLMRKTSNGWRFFYQHFSTPDLKASEGETLGHDKISKENLELRNAIKRRTAELEIKNRELEVDAALDRIRARVTDMNQSSDLLDIVVTIRDEFVKLGHEAHYFWHMRWLPDKYEKAMTSGDGSRIGNIMELPRDFHHRYDGVSEWESGKDPCMILALETEEAVDYIDKMITLGKFHQVDPNAPTLDDIRHIQGITFVMARTSHGEIGYSLPGVVKNPPKEDLDILVRFAKTFDLAHRRFLDLQKAEAQAREAQIEAALERVRSRTMGMQKSDELLDVASVMFQQVKALGVPQWNCGFNIWEKGDESCTYYPGSPDGKIVPFTCEIPLNEHHIFRRFEESKKRGEELLIYEKEGEEQKDHYAYMLSLPGVGDFLRKMMDADFELPSYQIDHVANFAYGNLLFITFEPFPEMHDVFIRFAKVFEQTYTRFLDLQKAETQAREAQIEAALERVRSRTMGMIKSNELSEVASVLFKQITELNIAVWTTGFNIWSEDDTEYEDWITTPKGGFIEPYKVDTTKYAVFIEVREAKQRGDDFFVQYVEGENLKKMYAELCKYAPPQFEVMLQDGFEFPKHQYNHFVFENSVSLMFITYEPLPEAHDIFKRFGKVFQQTYTRFLDLQKAETQAREAQIEAALERVRARSMAMHKSEELLDVISVVSEQLRLLEFKFVHVSFANNDRDQDYKFWTSAKGFESPMRFNTPYINIAVFNNLKGAIDKSLPFFADIISRKEHIRWQQHLMKHGGSEVFTEEDSEIIMSRGMARSMAINPNIILIVANYASIPYSEEENKIIIRFGQVFEQSYTRFLDLQKAEAQAREAQIEAALERVRSKTMAMHGSSDVKETVKTLFDEVSKLGIDKTIRCGIGILEGHEKMETWSANANDAGEVEMRVGMLNMEIHPMLVGLKKAWNRGEKEYVYEYSEKDVLKYYTVLNNEPDYPFNADLKKLPKGEFHKSFFFSSGIIFTFTESPLTEDASIVLHRFAEVFGQTYRRYLDLRKAEAQAREAQIEASLEKVRSHSLAMQNSNHLSKVINTVSEQLSELNIRYSNVSFGIDSDDSDYVFWTSISGQSDPVKITVPYIDHPITQAISIARKKKQNFLIDFFPAEVHGTWLNHALDHSALIVISEKEKEKLLTLPLTRSAALLPNIFLVVANYTHIPYSEADNAIIARFGQVFEQSYRRFLDLQKAEKQARETVKRASVDRVRAEIASMRTATDLERITPLIWNELTTLDVPFIRCGVFIMDEESQQVSTHLSTPEGKALASFQLPFEDTKPLDQLLPHWRRNEIYTDHWDKESFIESTKILMEKGAISSKETYLTKNQPTNLHLHFMPFLQGMLYVGSEVVLTEDELSLVQNLAEAFSSAYARYEDFNRLELANKKIEKTLVDLKQAQSQLVQSEKMASLGELTAGIAHEIQNPLNFVNNFSEVSQELMEEMYEEIKNGELEEALEIGTDIEHNLKKIHHHGQRASEIVKGMLQHSRSSSGERELTDINALTDEYLRLAYHGLRAKDKTFNAKMDTDFDDKLQKIQVIPQEIGRVILNLITNAFYAVDQKKKLVNGEFEPKVLVCTKKTSEGLEIKVIDNGNGIPKKVLEKIFQPFFTTKPTGQGTGLGLSLSYDIVKAHGGQLKVETKDGEGTEFIIKLPE